jgi:tetraacyldisaccharide 4'-kinase
MKPSYRARVPVISVGNVTAGGTGKTPMVDFLVKKLVNKGINCAVVSRGYGGQFRGAVARVGDHDGSSLTPAECGDEPFLLAVRNPGTPVYVARQRKLGVRRAERDGAQIIILDDGFQHLAVARDLDLLLLDADQPFGNGRTLPAGMLREPIAAVHRSDLIILTRSTGNETISLPLAAPILRCHHQLSSHLEDLSGHQVSVQDIANQRCLAFAGIAKPDAFFDALRQAGLKTMTAYPLADHQDYSEEVLMRLREASDGHDLMITTQKDAVKLGTVDFPVPCYSIGVELVFEETELLDNSINQLVENRS